MAKVAYFDCFSGVSGNMILGALLDAGLSLEDLQDELNKLAVTGFNIKVNQVKRQGISAVHVEVDTEETHAHRHLHHIVDILEKSSLEQQVKDDCRKIFTRLAEAEATVHNTTVDRIHFHEVGALDAIVDIVGAVAGLRKLDVEKIYVSPFSFGTGFTVCAHGKIPVPVPATVELLKEKPVRYTEIEAELVTPTGAAILSTLGDHFGSPPLMSFEKVGYGAGTKELPIPNTLRLFLGQTDETSAAYDRDTIAVIEANIDDMNPQLYEYLFEKLFEAGALDVYTISVMMKKNRPGIVLSVLAPSDLKQQLINVVLRETTTIGVRWQEMQRVKAQREIRTVETQYGPVRIKISRFGEKIINISPEYDDCKKLAQAQPNVPLKYIYQEALQQARSIEHKN
jgi:uncharacterized protein (TIGR00299 family) protein